MLLFRRVHEWIFTLLFRPFFFFLIHPLYWKSIARSSYDTELSYVNIIYLDRERIAWCISWKVTVSLIMVRWAIVTLTFIRERSKKPRTLFFFFFPIIIIRFSIKDSSFRAYEKKERKILFFLFFFAISLLNS